MQRTKSLLDINTKHSSQNILNKRAERIQQRHSSFGKNHVKIRCHCHPLIASFTGQHLIQSNTETPNITFLWIFAVFVSLGCHIFRWTYIVDSIGSVSHSFHLAVTKINQSHLFLLLGFESEHDIVRLQITMHYSLSPHMQVPLQHLLKKIQSLGLVHPFGVLFQVVSQSATFHQLQNQIDKLPLRRHFIQFYSILWTRQLHPTQRSQSADLATEKIPGHLILNHPRIDCLHCHLFLWVIFVIPKVDITSWTSS